MSECQSTKPSATLKDERESALDEVLSIFSDSAGAPSWVRAAMHAAFMRGAWTGKAFTSVEILDLEQCDRADVLNEIRARHA